MAQMNAREMVDKINQILKLQAELLRAINDTEDVPGVRPVRQGINEICMQSDALGRGYIRKSTLADSIISHTFRMSPEMVKCVRKGL